MMKQFLQVCSWGILAILSVGSPAPARAQTSQGSVTPVQERSSAQGKPRPKKTWTEDDVTSLRKPWDKYEDEKALAAHSSARASASAKQQSAVPPSAGGSASQTRASSDPSLPKTNEEAEAQIHEKEAEIRQKQQVLDKSSRDLESADNDFDRSALKSNVEIAKVDLETSKDDLKQLQARQAELKSKATAPPGSEQANPPAQ